MSVHQSYGDPQIGCGMIVHLSVTKSPQLPSRSQWDVMTTAVLFPDEYTS